MDSSRKSSTASPPLVIEGKVPAKRLAAPPQFATPAGDVPAGTSSPPRDSPKNGKRLLDALWPSLDRVHQIGAFDQRSKLFRNIPVHDADQAVRRGLALSDAGFDSYFACAEYLTPNGRKVANVSGACAFWLDLDCGAGKAAAGKGYATVQDAGEALVRFCKGAGLPQPTHIVSTGRGLHIYWALHGVIDRETWQAYAPKLKHLTHDLGFLADDSRTADITSVLRVPGTLNYKYDPPRPVSLLYTSDEFVDRAAMLDAIDAAYDRLCPATGTGTPTRLVEVCGPNITGNGDGAKLGPPNLETLASALVVLTPDCDERTWKLGRLAPMARQAREYPAYAEALRELAKKWSSGKLGGIESVKWNSPGHNGRTGEEVFDAEWDRFLKSNYAGKPVTLATIYRDARCAGWEEPIDPADRFEIIRDEDGAAA